MQLKRCIHLISDNELPGLPPSIKNFRKLESLDISRNRFLTKLPANICYLENLEVCSPCIYHLIYHAYILLGYSKNQESLTFQMAERLLFYPSASTAQKMKFSIKDFFSKYDQIRSFLRIWLHLPKKCLIENFVFCAVVRLFIQSAFIATKIKLIF